MKLFLFTNSETTFDIEAEYRKEAVESMVAIYREFHPDLTYTVEGDSLIFMANTLIEVGYPEGVAFDIEESK